MLVLFHLFQLPSAKTVPRHRRSRDAKPLYTSCSILSSMAIKVKSIKPSTRATRGHSNAFTIQAHFISVKLDFSTQDCFFL